MLIYKAVSELKEEQKEEGNDLLDINHSLIETSLKLFKKRRVYKTHRNVFDTEMRFIKELQEKTVSLDDTKLSLIKKVVTKMEGFK